MTPLEGETAILGLVALGVIPWAWIAAGKLKTAAQSRRAGGSPDAAEKPAPKAAPAHPGAWQNRGRDPVTGQFLPAATPLREAGRA